MRPRRAVGSDMEKAPHSKRPLADFAPDFAPYLKPMLAQVTKLRVIKLGKHTKGPSAASPSHQDGVQSH